MSGSGLGCFCQVFALLPAPNGGLVGLLLALRVVAGVQVLRAVGVADAD